MEHVAVAESEKVAAARAHDSEHVAVAASEQAASGEQTMVHDKKTELKAYLVRLIDAEDVEETLDLLILSIEKLSLDFQAKQDDPSNPA